MRVCFTSGSCQPLTLTKIIFFFFFFTNLMCVKWYLLMVLTCICWHWPSCVSYLKFLKTRKIEKCQSSFCHTHSAVLETVFPEAAGIHHMDVHSMIPTNRAELPQGCKMKLKLLPALLFSSELVVFAELSVNALLLLEWKTSTKYLMPGRYSHSSLCCMVAVKRATATCQPSVDYLTAWQGKCLT